MSKRVVSQSVYKAAISAADVEIEQLQAWVDDLQSGMFVNCVYCGYRYGPEQTTALTMREALYQHIAKCPKHPLSKANAEIEQLQEAKSNSDAMCEQLHGELVSTFGEAAKEMSFRCDRSDIDIDEAGKVYCHCLSCEFAEYFLDRIKEVLAGSDRETRVERK